MFLLSAASYIANPWTLGAGIVYATDLTCRGTSYLFPSVTDSSFCQVPRNIVQETVNTISNSAKGAGAAGNFIGALNSLSSRVLDLANHPYAPHICAGVVATAVGTYVTLKVMSFMNKHRESGYHCDALKSEANKNNAEADASRATTTKTHLEMKVVETELEKVKLEVEIKKLELEEKKLQLLLTLKARTHKMASTQTDSPDNKDAV